MKDGIIFVAGIYGVGKSTLCERLGLSIGVPCYSAGDLISALNGETYGRNKTVVNKEKNQDILVAAVNDRLQKDTAFILAGHFCIFDGFYAIPNCFSKKKEDAERFAKCMHPYIGNYDCVYTRNEKGRELLLEGRVKALANREERCISHKKVKGALE